MNYDINTFLLAHNRTIEFVKNHAHLLHVNIRRHLYTQTRLKISQGLNTLTNERTNGLTGIF